MMKIGELSILSKVTVKTIRYYESEGLLSPSYIDYDSSYRYYDLSKLEELNKIVLLRNIGLSIKDIKSVLAGKNINEILIERTKLINKEISSLNNQLSQIELMMKESKMNKVFIKELPECIVYSKEGIIKNYDAITEFVFSAANEVRETNPNLECSPLDYCYVEYLDGEYKEENISVRYSEAVTKKGVDSKTVKFNTVNATKAVCIKHYGPYANLRESYKIILNFISNNKYEMSGTIRECYIDGCWNKENEEEYLTEIQIPVK